MSPAQDPRTGRRVRRSLAGAVVSGLAVLLGIGAYRRRHAEAPQPSPEPEQPKDVGPIPRRPLLIAALAAVALLGWGAWGHYDRAAEASQTQKQTHDFVPTVQVATAKREDGPVPFTLPGTVSAFDQATLYARATGYVAERRVDIGSRVSRGDLLVRISAPDLDQQLAQANAQLVQMQAALEQANAQSQQAGFQRRPGQGDERPHLRPSQSRLGDEAERRQHQVGARPVASERRRGAGGDQGRRGEHRRPVRDRAEAAAPDGLRAGDRPFRRRDHEPRGRYRRLGERRCQWVERQRPVHAGPRRRRAGANERPAERCHRHQGRAASQGPGTGAARP